MAAQSSSIVKCNTQEVQGRRGRASVTIWWRPWIHVPHKNNVMLYGICGQKVGTHRIYTKKLCLCMVYIVCHIKQSIIGVKKFSEWQTRIKDKHRVSRPVENATPAMLQCVKDIIRADWRVTIDTVATTIECSHGQAYNIMHDLLGFHKVCSCWVPSQLKPQCKSSRMGLSLQHLLHYQNEGDDTLSQIITGDESWVHHWVRDETNTLIVETSCIPNTQEV
jgi:hypothetical protein